MSVFTPIQNRRRWRREGDPEHNPDGRRVRLRHPPELKERLAEAQNWRCCHCGERFDGTPGRYPTLEHVVPFRHGGADDESNLVVACKPCNEAYLPVQGPQLRGLPRAGPASLKEVRILGINGKAVVRISLDQVFWEVLEDEADALNVRTSTLVKHLLGSHRGDQTMPGILRTWVVQRLRDRVREVPTP